MRAILHRPNASLPVPTLPDDDQIERLAQLLEQRAVPFKGFNLEALDGYLSALVLSPEPVPASEWQPPVWGSPPRWDDARRWAGKPGERRVNKCVVANLLTLLCSDWFRGYL